MKNNFLLLVFTLLSTLTASAYDAKINGIYYIFFGTVATVTNGDGTKYTGSVTIPESFTYNGVTYSVTSIGYQAFSGCSGLTSVTIGNSVTEILWLLRPDIGDHPQQRDINRIWGFLWLLEPDIYHRCKWKY